jgi:predicted neuraminidase
MSITVKKYDKEFIVPFEERPTDSAHASTLLEMDDGSVLAAWFGGSWEKDPNVAIWMSLRDIKGNWSKPWIISDVHGIAMWNPVLFRTASGKIMLFYKVGAVIPEWKTFVKESLDEGMTWSDERELVPGDVSGGRGPVKDKPILLHDGKTIVAPASVEANECWDAFVDISTDDGMTWKRSMMVPVRHASYNIQLVDQPYECHRLWGKGMIQPTLWEDKEGLHMFCRTGGSAIFRSDSTDGGNTWNLAYDTGLPNNNSGIDLVRLQSGALVLAYNPVGNLPNFYKGPRTPLSLAYSEDDGKSWSRLFDLETEPGGYAYPAIIQGRDGSLLLTYTHRRERICFWRIEIKED